MNNIWYTQTESHEYGYIQMEISKRIHNWLTRMPEYPDVHSLQQDQPLHMVLGNHTTRMAYAKL